MLTIKYHRITYSNSQVESIVTLLFYYHGQQFFRVSPSNSYAVHLSLWLSSSLVAVALTIVCIKPESKSIYRVQCCVIKPRSVYHIFSRSFDICRSIENWVLCIYECVHCIKQIAGVCGVQIKKNPQYFGFVCVCFFLEKKNWHYFVVQVRKMIHCFKLFIRLNWRGKPWVHEPLDFAHVQFDWKTWIIVVLAATLSWLLFFLLIKIFYRKFGIKNRQSTWQIDTQMIRTHTGVDIIM